MAVGNKVYKANAAGGTRKMTNAILRDFEEKKFPGDYSAYCIRANNKKQNNSNDASKSAKYTKSKKTKNKGKAKTKLAKSAKVVKAMKSAKVQK